MTILLSVIFMIKLIFLLTNQTWKPCRERGEIGNKKKYGQRTDIKWNLLFYYFADGGVGNPASYKQIAGKGRGHKPNF